LNLALSQGGINLHIEANTIIDKPIALVHISTSTSAGKHRHLNHRITLGEGAKASLVVYTLGSTVARSVNNLMIHADLKANSHLGFYIAQNENQDSVHIQGLHLEQASGSTLDSFIMSLGAKLSRIDVSTVYLGSQACAHMNGLYAVSDKQHVDIHLNAEHIATHCSTYQNIRGMADGSAKAVFNGRICVHKNAVKSYSEQANHNLLLSSTAEIDTKPELEIYNDDVKCAHGATVGQLDQDALFYLMARGISKHEALAILRQAFVEQQFELIQDEKVKSHFKDYYEARR
jgi:Fe-S cluster assembly protein SufD